MKQRVLVLGTKAYQTEFQGTKYTGLKVAYVLEENSTDPDVVGHFPAENKFPYDFKSKIKEIPGIYDFEAVMVNKKNKSEIEFTDLTFIESVELPWTL